VLYKCCLLDKQKIEDKKPSNFLNILIKEHFGLMSLFKYHKVPKTKMVYVLIQIFELQGVHSSFLVHVLYSPWPVAMSCAFTVPVLYDLWNGIKRSDPVREIGTEQS
jgi:hypothetical protein